MAWHRDFRSELKRQLPEDSKLLMSKPNHFDASGFVQRGEKFVYFSVSDIRFWQDQWYKHILIRTAKSERDYTGGSNNYTTLERFERDVDFLLTIQES
jgi:hypothetical protein